MKLKKFLKVGEFARICGTTRETLLHYDRKGILKPKYIGGNGYRGYGIEQYFDFDLISLLKEGGASLEEIKTSRNTEKDTGYLSLLEKQIGLLKNRQKQLARRLFFLGQLVEISRESMAREFDKLFFEERETQYAEFYEVDSEKMLDREASIECYSNCLVESLLSGDTLYLPLGNIIPQKHALNREYRICYFFRNAYEKKDAILKEIPSGRYACLFHRGDMESHKKIFNAMLDEIAKSGLKILGDVYVYDQMSYVLAGTSPDFIAKYVVRVDFVRRKEKLTE